MTHALGLDQDALHQPLVVGLGRQREADFDQFLELNVLLPAAPALAPVLLRPVTQAATNTQSSFTHTSTPVETPPGSGVGGLCAVLRPNKIG